MKTRKHSVDASNAGNDPYAPLRGFEAEQAKLAAGREIDYSVAPKHVTSELKRAARKSHCLAIPVRGVTANGIPFLHFGEHQVMQSWETPYMQELATVATSALDAGDVLELGYGMGISGGFVQTAVQQWNQLHPDRKRAHHMSELNLDVAADCLKQNEQAITAGHLILHVGDWRELLADLAGEITLLDPASIQSVVARWDAPPLRDQCHHVVAFAPSDALAFMNQYKEAIADARIQLHVGNWSAMRSRLAAADVVQNRVSVLERKTFGGALLDTYALTSDERHFNQIPALQPVQALLADGALLTYYGDAEKDFQPLHRQALIDAGFHPDNIDCSLFSFETHVPSSAYKNKYNKLSGMIVPRITAGPPKHRGRKLTSSRDVQYTQPDSGKYHQLSAENSLAYSQGWFSGKRTLLTEEDVLSMANKVQRLFEHFGGNSTGAERIIEVGPGPSLHTAIAAAPFCKEYIGLERSPANTALTEAWIDGYDAASAATWEGWREIAGLCYAQTAATGGNALRWLDALKTKHPKLYQTIREWNRLPSSNQTKITLLSEARATEQKTNRKNPFLAANSFVALIKGKMKFITADIIEEVDGSASKLLANVQPYVGTADAVLANYVHESVNPELIGVAHSLLNTAKLAKPGGLLMNSFMEKTFQYSGFLVPLEECYASASVFMALQAQIASVLSSPFTYLRVDPEEVGVVVRPGYMGAAAFDGHRKAVLPSNGKQLLEDLHAARPTGSAKALITLQIRPKPKIDEHKAKHSAPARFGYCLASEQPTFETDMTTEYARLYNLNAASTELRVLN
ncbi:MAG TPA: hypothetical protein VJP80_04985 [Candidatus Saccharimonadales bacterium]|nr:hypothetical protein [Candidatus Saccharimonadales bacterium]